MIGVTQGILVMTMKKLHGMLVVSRLWTVSLLTTQLEYLMIPILDMGMMKLSCVTLLGMKLKTQHSLERGESRMVFRKLGFVMIYTVASEMSLSVLIPSLALISI